MKEILGESLTSECLQSCLVCSLPCSGSVGMSEGRGCVLVTGCQARVPRDLRSSTQVKIALGKQNTTQTAETSGNYSSFAAELITYVQRIPEL